MELFSQHFKLLGKAFPTAASRSTLTLLTLALLATVVRVWELGRRGFWSDEVFGAIIATRGNSLADMMSTIRAIDVHPPLFYVLLWLWARLTGVWATTGYEPGIEAIFRLVPVICGVATVILTYVVARKVFNDRVALLAALLTTFSPLLIIRDRELRMYPLLTLLALASFYLLLHALERKRRVYWLAYGLLVAALLYTHYLALFILFGQGIYILLRWRDVRVTVMAAVAPIFLYAFWLPHFLASVLGGWGHPGSRPSPLLTLQAFFSDVVSPFPNILQVTILHWLLLLLFWVAVLVGFFASRHLAPSREYLLWGTPVLVTQFLLPFVVWWATSMWLFNTMMINYVSFLLPFLYMACAAGLSALIALSRLIGWTWVTILLLGFALNSSFVYPTTPAEPWRDISEELRNVVEPEDAFWGNSLLPLMNMMYYLPQLWQSEELLVYWHFWEPTQAQLDAFLGQKRIWLVATVYSGYGNQLFPPGSPSNELLWSWIERNGTITHAYDTGQYLVLGLALNKQEEGTYE